MKHLRTAFLLSLVLIFSTIDIFALQHFVIGTTKSTKNTTVVVPTAINPKIGNDPLTANDEIGVFDADGNCWGADVWNGTSNLAIKVIGFEEGDPDLGIPDEPGFATGVLMRFRIWDSETNTEYNVVTAVRSGGGSLNFNPNTPFYTLSQLQAQKVPAVPVITNPLNNSNGIALAGNLTWNAAADATSYDYDLSANADFSSPILTGNTTNLSVAYTGLANGTTYYFRVRGKNAVGNGNYATSTFNTKLPKVTLTTPANNAKAQPLAGTLGWNSVTGATSYDVKVATDAGFTNIVLNTNVAGTTTNYNGFLNFTNYFWKVQAKNGANFGDESDVFTFQTLLATPAFTNPLNNAAGVPLSGTFTWSAVNGTTFYKLYVADNAGFVNPKIEANAVANNSFDYEDLSPCTLYYAKVVAANADGEGEYANITFTTVVGKPTLLTPANNAKGQPLTGNLTWAAVNCATSYDVQVASDAGFINIIHNVNVAGTTFAYNVPNNNTNYFWKVRAKNADGTGAFSDQFNFKTVIASPVFTQPLNNAVGVPVLGNFNWNAVNGATYYKIQVATDVNFANIVFFNNNVPGTSVAYTNLSNFTNYFARLFAGNADSESPGVVITFRTVVGAPTNQTPSNNTIGNELTGNLTWTAVNGATLYDVQIATDANFLNNVIDINDVNGTTAPYNVPNFATKYYWHVRAKNAEGTGNYSNTTNFTTKIGPAALLTPADNSVNVNPLTGTFTWNAPATSTTHRIQVSKNANMSSPVIDVDNLAAASHNYSNLDSKTQYFWRVYSYSATNIGTWTNPFNFTTGLGKVVLASPANGAQGIDINGAILQWNALNGAATYRLIVSENADLSSPIINQGAINATQLVINGLAYNKTYYWGVRGQDVNGDGPLSDVRSFGTKVDKPTLTSPANNATEVSLDGTMSWNGPAGADAYQVQVSLVNDFATTVINVSNINGTSYNYTGLENDKTHFWRVRGYKQGGAGEWSNVFTFKTIKLQPPVLVSPANNKTDVLYNVTLDWNPVAEATSYNVRIATDINFVNVVAAGNNLSATQFDVTSLFFNRDYWWQAQSNGPLGTSNWSQPFKFTTLKEADFVGIYEVCQNTEAVYTAPASAIIDYNWSVTGGQIIGSSTTNEVTVKWTTSGTGKVKLTRTSDEWGNYSDSKEKNVTVNPIVNVVVTIVPNTYYDGKICINEPVEYSATFDKTGINEYSWIYNNNVVSTNATYTHIFNAKGTYYITLKVKGEGCKEGEGTYQVVVTDDCDLTVLADDFEVCKNQSPTVTPVVFGGTGDYSYGWTPVNDFFDATVKDATVKKTTYSKTLKFTLTDEQTEEFVLKNIYMTVLPSPSVSFNKTYHAVYDNNPVDLTNSDVLEVTVTQGTAPYNYVWRDEEDNVIDPTEIYPPIGSSKYYLTVYDDNGCASNEKKFTIIRYQSKENADEIVPGLAGVGYMFTYPNPTTDFINVFADFSEETNAVLKIYNTTGQIVYTMNIDNTRQFEAQLNVSQFTAGMYTIVIETYEDTIVKPFIKR